MRPLIFYKKGSIMQGYKATIIGENFKFIIDEETQYLDFIRTVYVDAADDIAAQESALAIVRNDLHAQSLLDETSEQTISLDIIQQVDTLDNKKGQDDFIWSFPDLDEYEYF